MVYRVLAILCLIWVRQYWCDENDTTEDDTAEYSPYVTELLSNTEYELVDIEFPTVRQRRLANGGMHVKHMRIRAFGENIELWLNPIDAVLINDKTSIYYVVHNPEKPGNVQVDKADEIMSLVGLILEDPVQLATFVLGNDNRGRVTINGQIHSKNLGIVSLWDPVNRSANEAQSNYREMRLQRNHAIYKLPISNTDKDHLSPSDILEKVGDIRVRQNHAYPRALYPEILVVVDWTVYRKVMNTIRFLEYVMAFVNGVDLKFRSWKTPRMRLRISGILIPGDSLAVPYITQNKIDNESFNYSKALDDSASFFNLIRDQIPLESYDLAITLTTLKFGVGNDATVRGSSFTGTVCESKSDGMYASAIVRDNRVFSGVYTTAHELGHLLGLYHDTPDDGNCYNSKGYIMDEYPSLGRNSVLFSPCSIRNMTEYLHGGKLSCLYNKPKHIGKPLPNLLPGKMVNRRKQCRTHGYNNACNLNTDMFCLHLYCRHYNGSCIRMFEQTLEGTRCSSQFVHPPRFCINGKCLRKRN